MARTALQKVYADFRQGFVTVANPLAYPEGSLKDIVNFDIQDNGTLRLRPGLRQETSTTVDTGETLASINNKALSVHVWDNVNNQGNQKIAVVQVGSNLYFYNMLDSGIDLDNPINVSGEAVGDPYDMGLSSSGEQIGISTASGSGWLFVAHPDKKPFVLKKEGSLITDSNITIRIRDLSVWEGRTETETGFVRSSYLYPQHEYNLKNAGWPDGCLVSDAPDVGANVLFADPLSYTNNRVGFYPPISVPFYAARNGGGQYVDEITAYSPWRIRNDFWGKSPIPRGKFIVNAESWTRDGKGASFLTADPLSNNLRRTYTWTQKPTSIEFYSGRVWYAGAKGYQESTSFAPSYGKSDDMDVSNTIYYSQQVDDNLNRVGKCYQENDPTAEDINQLLATDGGTLSIRGAGEILDMKTFGTALIVFTTEGLWSISGIDTNSFKADSFSVNKISNIGPSSKATISATNNNIYYIANDAIYVLTVDDVTGSPVPQDITSPKIKDFYNEIPYKNKEKARAFFDTANRNLYVFYSDVVSPETDTNNINYNRCLIFNQDLGSFYKYQIALDSHYIVDGFFYIKDQVVTLTDAVVSDADIVVSDGDPVVLETSYSTAALNNVQLLTIVDDGTAKFTFSSFTDLENREDWGNAYTGYVEFGFDTAGDIMRDSIKAPVLISHMERTEDGFEVNPQDPEGQELILANSSGCLLSYGWDWASSYKNPIQIYRFHRNYVPSGTDDPFNYGVDVITTRNRIRGKGHSLGVRLDSEAGKDCRVLGIGILYTAAQRV